MVCEAVGCEHVLYGPVLVHAGSGGSARLWSYPDRDRAMRWESSGEGDRFNGALGSDASRVGARRDVRERLAPGPASNISSRLLKGGRIFVDLMMLDRQFQASREGSK